MVLEIQKRMLPEILIGSRMPVKSFESQHTIQLIRKLNTEIPEIEEQI